MTEFQWAWIYNGERIPVPSTSHVKLSNTSIFEDRLDDNKVTDVDKAEPTSKSKRYTFLSRKTRLRSKCSRCQLNCQLTCRHRLSCNSYVSTMRKTDSFLYIYFTVLMRMPSPRIRTRRLVFASMKIYIQVMLLLSGLRVVSAEDNVLDVGKLTPDFPEIAGLYPSVVNLASRAVITANATCGQNRPVKYCKLVEHVDQTRRGHQCSICDATSLTSLERHPIENAIDGRGKRWWQSPTIEQGYHYHWVTVTLDLKQVYQVAYIIIKAANSPRPGNWILEKSIDEKTWEPWQFFAISDQECQVTYGMPAAPSGAPRYRFDTEVMCTSYFSSLDPFENGEIHVSLINGRPSAENPSSELVAFTSARYVRLRMQKIRTLNGDLMTLSYSQPGYADPLVTRRYYYSIKDISIGGMCICYGHASSCPASSSTGDFSCNCEHNTAGSNCEICAPGFNQYKWQPGNNGFKCEACNCHGHAEECYYDAEVEERGESLNIHKEYAGGGVCTGCRDNTAGVNCETCADGYYRPIYVEPHAIQPCRPCVCNPYGGARYPENTGPLICVKDITSINLEDNNSLPGRCICKPGYTGEKCDRCAYGYRGFPLCDPCPCNASGSANPDVCQGECICKKHVEGDGCSKCTEGYYNLQESNPNGCDSCYCFGVTHSCQSSTMRWSAVHTNYGWAVRGREGRRKCSALIDPQLQEPYVHHETVTQVLQTTLYYWSAPKEYLGSKLLSYDGKLSYIISYDIAQGDQATPVQHPDVILEGNGKILIYNLGGILVEPQIETEVSIKLAPGVEVDTYKGWVDSVTLQPISKADMMSVLLNVNKLLIRAVYSRNNKAVYRIRDVKLDVAQTKGEGMEASSVEVCLCPTGYTGSSCETCTTGYWRSNDLCLPCQCHGHSSICNSLNGACQKCEHNTMGTHCERCKPGSYGDATLGTPNDCESCACPLPLAGNNFSPTCRSDRANGGMVCLQCPQGHTGKRCEICDQGYFGEPAIPGGRCQACECNDNSFTCDRRTGRCLSCQGHTAGEHCERCEAAYYGDAVVSNDCQPCDCHQVGSLTRQCNMVTGQCICKRGIFGKKCDMCTDNHYLNYEARACVTCDCSSLGSVTPQCETDGKCICKKGVEGQFCDVCSRGYFEFSSSGCKECNCDMTNGNCDPHTGECVCPLNTQGFKCMTCTPGSYQWNSTSGCKDCNCGHIGIVEGSQCNNITGLCQCKREFGGRQCNECREGYFGYPNCKPCNCNKAGTSATSCTDQNSNMCSCSEEGQCVCKPNVVGRNCDQCAPNSFTLSFDHPHGCTSCYCSGVTNRCEQAHYVWGISVSLNVAAATSLTPTRLDRLSQSFNFAENRFQRRPKTKPLYWSLPEKFRGDKSLSYGGTLRYTIRYHSKFSALPEVDADASVIIEGGDDPKKTIQFKSENPASDTATSYTVSMRERLQATHVSEDNKETKLGAVFDKDFLQFGWRDMATGEEVTRKEFVATLKNIHFLLIKASYGYLMNQSQLSDVYLDVAEPGLPGRGDDASDFPLAGGLEHCLCPPGYSGLSCQDCSPGYMRVQQGSDIGNCQHCGCNNRSSTCHRETGLCLNCIGNFTGDHCEKCKPGYYLAGEACKKCQCPGEGPDNNFSPTCQADGFGDTTDYTCDSCIHGYEGKHCEVCANGYYGNPKASGGFCSKCGCNIAGSVDGMCNKTTGQCHCDEGIQGRICDQCLPRHVITSLGCTKCNDVCVDILLNEIDSFKHNTTIVDMNDKFPPPWGRLMVAQNSSDQLQERLSKSSNDIQNSLVFVNRVENTEISDIEERLSPIINMSESCTNNTETTIGIVKKTYKRTKKIKKQSKSFLSDVETSKRHIRRLRNQLQNGSTQDTNEMRREVGAWLDEIESRDLSVYLRATSQDIQLTQDLLDSHINNFTKKAKQAEENFNVEKQQLLRDLELLFLKLNDTEAKFTQVALLLNAAMRKNEMNKQYIGQTAAEIDKLENEVIITNNFIEDGLKILKKGNQLYKDGRLYMNMLLDEQLVKSNLRNVTKQIKNLLDTSLNPAPRELMMKVKKVVEDYKRDLQAKADYIEKVHQEVSQISHNQTEAASRWTNIAEAVNGADRTALAAKKKAEKSLVAAQSNLDRKSETSLRQSNRVYRGVFTQKLAVESDRDQLRLINDELRVANLSATELKRKHDLLLNQLNKVNSGFLSAQSPVSADDVHTAVGQADPILNEVNTGLLSLQQTYQQLDVAYLNIEKHQEMRNSAIETLDAIPVILNENEKKAKKAKERSNQIALLSDTVQRNISNIRKLIEDTKRKAASIRVSVKSEGKCAMLYSPELTSAKSTEIMLNVQTKEPNNLLFYLARKGQDYLAVETRDHHVIVTWDLGGGIGYVENPIRVFSHGDKDWYRIEISRSNQVVNVTVYQTANKTMTIQTTWGSSPGSYAVLDIDDQDQMYIGSVMNDTKLPSSIRHRTFTGCMGEVFLQGKSVGLWNFRNISNKNDCRGCEKSERLHEDAQVNVYSFTALSYSMQKLPSYNKSETGFSFQFQTFSSNGLLMFMGAKKFSDFLSLELIDGFLSLKLDFGDGFNIVNTRKQYNSGDWISVAATVNRNNVVIALSRNSVEDERIEVSFSATDDVTLDLEADGVLYVGGIPNESFINKNVTRISFVGCLREFEFMEKMLRLKASSSGEVIQDSGLTYSCPSKINHDIGIANEGFVEIPPMILPTISSISITFNTRETNALLLLATDEVANAGRRKRQNAAKYFSLYLSGGRIHARIQLSGDNIVNLSSRQNFYDDGRPHLVSLTRRRGRFTLQMNEGVDDKVVATLEKNIDQVISTRHVFVGGLPQPFDVSRISGVENSLNGCIRELVVNNFIDFKTAIRSKNVFLGTCQYVDFDPEPIYPSDIPDTPSGLLPPSTTSSTAGSPLVKDGSGFVAIPTRKPDDPYCRAPGKFEVRKNSAQFGSSPYSHLKFILKKKITKSFLFEMKIRTLSDSGLLLHSSHPTQNDFFALKLKDGKPLFQFDNGKGRAEVIGAQSINDGKWHKLRIRRSRRKGWLLVDKQKRKSVVSKKGASLMDVSSELYVGGLPKEYDRKKLGQISSSMDICIRDLTLNKNISLNPLKAYSSFQVQSCFKKVTSGAYFNGSGYAIQKKQYRVGQNMLVEMEFRTWRSNGVILSVENKKVDGLSIELVNGSIVFRANNGGGPFEANFTSPSLISSRKRRRFPLCDGRWHKLRAEKMETTLLLTVDGIEATNVISSASTSSADTWDPLYIGGIPDSLPTPKLLHSNENFEGCMRNLRIKANPVSFDESYFRRGVFPKTCPTPKRRKKRKHKKNRIT